MSGIWKGRTVKALMEKQGGDYSQGREWTGSIELSTEKVCPERDGLNPPMMNCAETDERITIDFVTKATLARGTRC